MAAGNFEELTKIRLLRHDHKSAKTRVRMIYQAIVTRAIVE